MADDRAPADGRRAPLFDPPPTHSFTIILVGFARSDPRDLLSSIAKQSKTKVEILSRPLPKEHVDPIWGIKARAESVVHCRIDLDADQRVALKLLGAEVRISLFSTYPERNADFAPTRLFVPTDVLHSRFILTCCPDRGWCTTSRG